MWTYAAACLTIAWTGQDADTLCMTGPAATVFEGQIDIPDLPMNQHSTLPPSPKKTSPTS